MVKRTRRDQSNTRAAQLALFFTLVAFFMSIGRGETWADEAVATGVPEFSIASRLPADPVRASLASSGITYGANYIGEVFGVVSGGLERSANYNGLLEGYTDLDLGTLTGWRGATIHTNVYSIHGDAPAPKLTGSIFPLSSVEALDSYRLDELWFEQTLLDDTLKIRFGSLAADTEFFLSDSAGQFLNGTFGWAGVLALDMTQGGPAYPLTSIGARVQFAPTKDLKFLGAVFDGSPADPNAPDAQRDNRHGTSFRFGDSPLYIGEGQFSFAAGLPGVVKVGAWKQTNDDYVDLLTGDKVNGSYGLYGIIDQQIWNDGNRGLSVFGRVSGSPERQNPMDVYFDTGIVFTGFVPGRAKDTFGAAFGYGSISDRQRQADIVAGLPVISNYESVLEVNYKAEVTPGLLIVPDFQYFWHPGGHVEDPNNPGQAIDHAAVLGLRTRLSY